MPLLPLANVIVKGCFIGQSSIQGDEPFSVYHAQMDVSSIVRLLSQGNNPPLYEILLHYWIQLFGISAISVRLPSLIFSTITVWLLFKIGNKFFNRRVALISCIIFIFSNFQISLTHEARVYQLLGLLTAYSMFVFMEILNAPQKSTQQPSKHTHQKELFWKFFVLSIINTLVIYSHYFGFFVLIVQWLFLLIHRDLFKSMGRRFLLSTGFVALLYSPNILVVFQRFSESSSGTWISHPSGIGDAYNMIRTFSNAPIIAVVMILSFIVYFIKYFGNRGIQHPNVSKQFVTFWFIFVFLFMFVISFWIPIFYSRYLMVCAIGYVVFSAVVLDSIFEFAQRKSLPVIMVFILFTATVNLKDSNKVNVAEIIRLIKKNQTTNSVVYFSPDWFDINFILYYNQKTFENYNTKDIKKNMHEYMKNMNVFPIKTHSDIHLERNTLADKILFLDANSNYHNPKNQIKKTLDSSCRVLQILKFPENYSLTIYQRKDTNCLHTVPLEDVTDMM